MDELRALVAKWRNRSGAILPNHCNIYCKMGEKCADELETALDAQPAPAEGAQALGGTLSLNGDTKQEELVCRLHDVYYDPENERCVICELRAKVAARPATAAPAEPGQIIADDILRRIAKRYANCEVNIYPDLPELTPVEAVLRCAKEEGFWLTNAPAPPSTPASKEPK